MAQVSTYGALYAVRICLNPQKPAAKQIGLDEVATAIQSPNIQIPNGTLYEEKQEYMINVDGQLTYDSLYDSIIIKNENGAIVGLRDVGSAIDNLSNDNQYTRDQTPESDTNCVVVVV